MAWARRALIITHGIGVQKRGSTRDALVSSLVDAGASDLGYQRGDPVAFGANLPPDPWRVRRGDVTADVYEVYWAPQSSRQTTARSVLWWMLRNTFLPGAALRKPSHKTLADVFQIGFLMALASFLLLLALTTLGNLSEEAACSTNPKPSCPPSARHYRPASLSGARVTWGGWLQLSDAGRAFGRAVRPTDRPLDDLTPTHASAVLTKIKLFTWLPLAAIVWLSAQILFRLPDMLSRRFLRPQILVLAGQLILLGITAQFTPPILIAFAWVLALMTMLLRTIRLFLAESVGDVQVYVNLDENNEHFAARQAILAEADRIFALVAERGYEEIIVFGHSLGSVIAFDVLDGLRLRSPPMLPRVKAFITFGAAIEKVRYFFDQKTPGGSDRNVLAPSAFAGVAIDRAWINIWYGSDVVANPITSLDEPGQYFRSVTGRPTDPIEGLLTKARQAPVVNLEFRRLWPPWPPIHSHYLKDRQIRSLLANVALSPDI